MTLIAFGLAPVIWTLVGVAAVVLALNVLSMTSKRRNRRTAAEVADFIENFLEGRDGPWDWDEFLTIPIADPDLDRVRERCLELPKVYPAPKGGGFCSEDGIAEMRRMVEALRAAQSC